MPSTSNSDDTGWLLKAEDLCLDFHVRLFPATTIRETFIRGLSIKGKRDTNLRTIVAVDRQSFEIRKGERLGIIGKNGSGKTSLCRCLAGIYTPTSGRILRKGTIHSVFGSGISLEPDLTGRGNLRLLARLLFPGMDFGPAECEKICEFSGLGDLVDLPVKHYSFGMQRRLVLTLLTGLPAEILLLDEVLDGADAEFQERFWSRLDSVIERSGATVLVSHNLPQIERLCNRVLVYDRGRIVFDGAPGPAIAEYRKL